MALPRRVDPEESGPPKDIGRRLQRRATGARLSWWWLWIVVICLVIWWAVWGWGGSGGWWRSSVYREGTNGGRVSEPLGQPTEEPAPPARSSIGGTANPNTGAHGHKAGGTIVTGEPNGVADNGAAPGSTDSGARNGAAEPGAENGSQPRAPYPPAGAPH